jgi:ubiquinone/menaquinone biosynthesis C-methylase UbiE
VRAVAGLDLSRTMLARLLDEREGEALHAVRGSASGLPFPARRFDAVVGVHVFHPIAAWREALGEIARVLRPQGCLLAGSDGPLLPARCGGATGTLGVERRVSVRAYAPAAA